MGTPSYDILANNDYSMLFQYISVAVPNRELYIIDDDEDESNDDAQSNMVRAALNMGYYFAKDH